MTAPISLATLIAGDGLVIQHIWKPFSILFEKAKPCNIVEQAAAAALLIYFFFHSTSASFPPVMVFFLPVTVLHSHLIYPGRTISSKTTQFMKYDAYLGMYSTLDLKPKWCFIVGRAYVPHLLVVPYRSCILPGFALWPHDPREIWLSQGTQTGSKAPSCILLMTP